KSALALSVALFTPLKDPREEQIKGEERKFRLPPNPVGRCDTWHYFEALKIVVPVLGKHIAMEALAAFADLLSEAVRLSRDEDDGEATVDYSFIWHDAIEEDTVAIEEVRDGLILAVRDLATSSATSKTNLLLVIDLLEHQRWDV